MNWSDQLDYPVLRATSCDFTIVIFDLQIFLLLSASPDFVKCIEEGETVKGGGGERGGRDSERGEVKREGGREGGEGREGGRKQEYTIHRRGRKKAGQLIVLCLTEVIFFSR